MTTVIKDVVSWLKQWYYTEDEVDTLVGGLQTQINNKAESSTVTSLTATVNGKADASHNHSSGDVTEASALNNLGTSANATQHTINVAINNKISSLTNIDLIKVVTALPTASSSTMNQLYVLAKTGGSGTDSFNVYVTIKNGSTYSWEDLDTTIDLSNYYNKSEVDSLLNDKAASSHAHGNITKDGKVGNTATKPLITGAGGVVQAGSFGTSAGTFCQGNDSRLSNSRTPTAHSSSATTYGVGSTANYGHNKIIDSLDKATLTNGESLSAHQGYVLKGLIDEKPNTTDIPTKTSDLTNDSGFLTSHQNISGKADKTSALGTTVTLINKGETNEGCIIFNTIS